MLSPSRWCTLALVSVLVLATACGGSDPTGPAAVTSVSVTTPNSTLTAIGETVQLSATAKSAKGGEIRSIPFAWSSSNSAVASVSGGAVTAVGNGSATISAASGTITGTVQITVQQTASQVAIAFISDTMSAFGDTTRALATAKDVRGNVVGNTTVVWQSSDVAVVAIDQTGLMTAVNRGSAVIRGAANAVAGERTVYVVQKAAKLVMTRQPSGGSAGATLATQPRLEVQDTRGNRMASDNATVVTATVASGGGVITTEAMATATAGIVNFASLSVGGVIGNKTLQFSAPTMAGVVSDAFPLSAGSAATLVVVGSGTRTTLAGTALPQPLQVGVRDAYTNAVSGIPVSFAVLQGGGGTVATAQLVSDQNGNATTAFTASRFAGLSVVRATTPAAPAAAAEITVVATPNGVIRGIVSQAVAARLAMTAASTAANTAMAAGATRGGRRMLVGAPKFNAAPAIVRDKPAPRTPNAIASPTPDTRAALNTVERPEAFVPGEWLVTYHADRIAAPNIGASAYRQTNVATAVRESILHAIAPMVDDGAVTVASVSPTVLTARVTIAAGAIEADVVARLRRDPNVQSVERNGLMYTHRVEPTAMQQLLLHAGIEAFAPTHSLSSLASYTFSSLTVTTFPLDGLYPDNALYASQSWHYNLAGLPQAWRLTQGSTNILIAIVDDGVQFSHPAMSGVLTNDGYDFVSVGNVALCAGGSVSTNGDGDGYDPDPTQPSSRSQNSTGTCAQGLNTNGNHGLHVAGTIGATRINASGVTGVNWTARIRMVRALGTTGSGSNYDIAQGVLYASGLPADNGAGGTVTAAGGPARVINMSLGGTSNNTTLSNAVAQAIANGSQIIASAGNNNNTVLNYPASYPNVISVSAVGPNLTRASYSSYGATVKIAAPGGELAFGSSYGVLSSTWNYVNNSPSVAFWQGTSMAAPHVTGIAALLLAREPSLTPEQLRERLYATAIDIGAAGPDQFFGAGLINARNTLTNSQFAPRTTYVRLINANTGAVVGTVVAGAGGAYQFGGLPDGEYWVFAGDDENADGLTGLPSRSWGALGLAAVPTAIVINGAAEHVASFNITTGFELEPNGVSELADELVVNGYMNGDLSSPIDVDFYRVRIGQSGTYTVQATGRVGACGFSNEADPIITVYSSTGSLLAENDDIDVAQSDYCARVSGVLVPGDYYVRVTAARKGRYVIGVRRQ